MKNIKGTLILLLTAFIWGTAFVAQTSAGDSLGTFTFNTIRNIIAACFLFIFIKLRESVHKEAECKSFPVKEGIVCGIVYLLINFKYLKEILPNKIVRMIPLVNKKKEI